MGSHLVKPVFTLSTLAVLLAACNMPSRPVQGTPGVETIAAWTVQAVLTKVDSTREPQATETANPADPPVNATLEPASPTPSANCIDRAAFVDDLTVRDNSLLQPGQTFVKIWRLENRGTCTWTQSYTLAFFGGERMDAPAQVQLPELVPPESTVDLSLDMTAPTKPGTHQGYWRLRNATGEYFGIGPNGDNSFWVKIIVPASPSETPVITQTPSPTPASPTPTTTPEDHESGSAALEMEDTFDFDTGQLNPRSGAEVRLEADGVGTPQLTPLDGTGLAIYLPPSDPPSPATCALVDLKDTPIQLDALGPGGFVCYRTAEGRPGYFLVTGMQAGIEFDYVTWKP